MVEKLCKNCKHWDEKPEDYMSPFRKCLSNKLEDVSGNFHDKLTDDMLISEDYESYASKILTGPNFGCVHFEEGDTK